MQVDDFEKLFEALGQVAQGTRQVLALALAHNDRPLPPREQDRLSAAVEHLGNVREGCVVTLRAAAVRSNSELRDLVRHVLVDWSWLEDLGLSWNRGEQRLEIPAAQVLAFAHAVVALAYLPQMPAAHVTYPSPRPSYADIPVPASPGEWLARIEELESVIDAIGERPPALLERERLRRTYGYFDASAWLVHDHGRR